MAAAGSSPDYNVGGERFNMHAYVCSVDCVRRLDANLGAVTFTWIYQNRPNGCRYAVAGQWDVARHAERFVVWDLHAAGLWFPINRLKAPRPKLMLDDLDAAIMATVMLYDQE